MEFARAGAGGGTLDVGDDFGGWGEGGSFGDGAVGGEEGDVDVGFGEEGFDLVCLGGDGGEGAAFEGAFGAGVS